MIDFNLFGGTPEEQLARDKKYLADKVLSGTKLTKEEKKEIYFCLTGEDPQSVKRGRPSTEARDMDIAHVFLASRFLGHKPHVVRKEIMTKFRLSPRDNTFYTALNRGMDTLSERAASVILDANVEATHGVDTKTAREYKDEAGMILTMIDDYREQNQHLKKR